MLLYICTGVPLTPALVVFLQCVAIGGFNGSTVSGSGGSKCGAGTIGPYFCGLLAQSAVRGLASPQLSDPWWLPCWQCGGLITPSVGMVPLVVYRGVWLP